MTAAARNVRFVTDELIVELEDGREVSASMTDTPWLRFLRDASDDARAHSTIEPHGFAVYWPDLDDGVEVCHLLDSQR